MTPNHPILENQEAELLEEIIKELGQLTKNPDFKLDLYTETAKQMSGDYDIKITDLAPHIKSSSPYHNSVKTLSSLAEEYKQISNGVELIVYYPRSIDFDKRELFPIILQKHRKNQPSSLL